MLKRCSPSSKLSSSFTLHMKTFTFWTPLLQFNIISLVCVVWPTCSAVCLQPKERAHLSPKGHKVVMLSQHWKDPHTTVPQTSTRIADESSWDCLHCYLRHTDFQWRLNQLARNLVIPWLKRQHSAQRVNSSLRGGICSFIACQAIWPRNMAI